MLKLAKIFTDSVVLQQQKPIAVWGEADVGAEVVVELIGCDKKMEVTCKATADGTWSAVLPPQPCMRDLSLKVSGGSKTIECRDVCVGEVWLAGGQSNMEFYLGYDRDFDAVQNNPDIRFFDYPEVAYEGALEDFEYRYEGFWRKATKEDLGYFSAVGFYFARNLQSDLNVPIGIVGCNWGGTPACAWMDPEYLSGTAGECWLKDYRESTKNLDMEAFLEDYKKDPFNDRSDRYHLEFNLRTMKNSIPREKQTTMLPDGVKFPPIFYERRPGGLYETMLKKVCPFTVRGVIWYQGETDGDEHADAYAEVFSRLIANWRDIWQDELPFLFVQLAPFEAWMQVSGEHYGIVREQQEQVSEMVSGTWMATSGDVGMQWDIHPKQKEPIGHRLALLARKHVYGEDIMADAPVAVSAKQKNQMVSITFKNAEGLHLSGDMINALVAELADGTKRVVEHVRITDLQIVFESKEKISSIYLGQTCYYEINLYNAAEIPTVPFSLPVLND